MSIELFGAVRVVAGDVEHVHVWARIVGHKDTVDAYRLEHERDGETLRIHAPAIGKGRGLTGIAMRVVVPRGTRVRAHAVAGAVAARGLDDLEIENRLGPVAVRDVGGTVHVQTGAGPIAIALTKNRTIRSVDVTTTAGPIALAVPRSFAANYEIDAHMGPVHAPASVAGGVPVRIRSGAGPIAIAVR
ncbi:MAG TPA: hypothetical protein VMD91_09515 [Candidatus Sulfotelmatobacter sp.]|nr:hypothetical protein [Candidatus Sulfotelmatobacter sp.]